jgi:AMP nucleosidase
MSYSMSEFDNPADAIARVTEDYKLQTGKLLSSYSSALKGQWPTKRVRAFYPQIQIKVEGYPQIEDRSQAFGYFSRPGIYKSTFTRPDILSPYYLDQLQILKKNHPEIVFQTGLSDVPIPISFALNETVTLDGKIAAEDVQRLRNHFDMPVPEDFFETSISNGRPENRIYPLARYNGPFIDRAMNFLKHHTGTNPEYFQKYILFTNYQNYITEFQEYARKKINEADKKNPYLALVEPGNVASLNPHIDVRAKFNQAADAVHPPHLPQMPAYHLVREDGQGVTIVNIGVGPSNAKTITDNLAPLRPSAWMMIGHCAGLTHSQKLGDYVIPNGYVLEEGLMEKKMKNVVIPELAEMHVAMTKAARDVLNVPSQEFRECVRTGVITTVADRNWENPGSLESLEALREKFRRNKSIGLEMETGTIAAQGFQHAVHYGGVLCITDKPLHGEPKMASVAQDLYRERTKQQFYIAANCFKNLRKNPNALHSRKLYTDFEYSPFR